jgi:hypothetical protein
MALLYKQGKINRRQLDDFVKGVRVSRLPKRVKPRIKKKK